MFEILIATQYQRRERRTDNNGYCYYYFFFHSRSTEIVRKRVGRSCSTGKTSETQGLKIDFLCQNRNHNRIASKSIFEINNENGRKTITGIEYQNHN